MDSVRLRSNHALRVATDWSAVAGAVAAAVPMTVAVGRLPAPVACGVIGASAVIGALTGAAVGKRAANASGASHAAVLPGIIHGSLGMLLIGGASAGIGTIASRYVRPGSMLAGAVGIATVMGLAASSAAFVGGPVGSVVSSLVA